MRSYHERQLEASARSWSYLDADGTLLGQKVTPLDRVGIYVPGGKAAYPSQRADERDSGAGGRCRRDHHGRAHAAGAEECAGAGRRLCGGVHRVFTIGGAQAVAALAYGTATIPRVDKITGPGNAYVASAKKHVFGQVGIDMIAGPSEILVLADGSTPPDWVAMDLFSQAEHDELAQSILLCPDAAYIDAVREAIERLLPGMPRQRGHPRLAGRPRRADPARAAWKRPARSATASRRSTWRSARSSRNSWEPLLRHAGAIFLGAFTSESLGDYCAGPNHVLPTSGTARFSSPLGVYDFVKRSSLIEVSERGAQVLGPIAAELAYGEGLQAHARAAELRLGDAAAPAAPTLAERIRHSIRQDVKSMHAYAIQDSRGLVKLDAMENPFRLPEALQRELGERLGRGGHQPLPGAEHGRRGGRAVAVRRAAGGLQDDPGQRLRRADRHAQRRLRRARRHAAGTAAGLRDVPDVGAAARPALRRRAADAGLRAGRGGDAGGHRSSTARR